MKRALKETFTNIPEGEQTVRIAAVDTSKYEKFDKLTITIEDAAGATARVNFNFVNDDGTPNDIADGIFTRMYRAAMNDQTLDECDTDELPGRFVRVEIVHKEGSNGGTFANVAKWLGVGEPFTVKKSTSAKATKPSAPLTPKKSAAEIIAEMKAKKAAKGA